MPLGVRASAVCSVEARSFKLALELEFHLCRCGLGMGLKVPYETLIKDTDKMSAFKFPCFEPACNNLRGVVLA